MTGFAADWLALRAPADDAARDRALVAALASWAAGRPLSVVDLGAGSGATLRALRGALPAARWRLIDDDADLLALAAEAGSRLGAAVETRRIDLARDLAAAMTPAPDLVTASAFFDLAGADWIDALAAAAGETGAAVYAALTYDGREAWSPPHPEDEAVHQRFVADMRRDKGLGPALGADAATYLAEALRTRGYRVTTASTPWRLAAPQDAALIAALADGSADATGASADWRAARRRAMRVEIGHIDVLALPG